MTPHRYQPRKIPTLVMFGILGDVQGAYELNTL
jgi:hypothetical protein